MSSTQSDLAPFNNLPPASGWRNLQAPGQNVKGVVLPVDPSAAERAQGRSTLTAADAVVVADHGGDVLDHVNIHCIFWGTAWTASPAPTPSATDVFNAVSSIVSGPYMKGLAEYRNIQPGAASGMTIVSTPVGGSPANPPETISDADIQNLLSDLIFRGLVPSPSTPQLLFCVVLPQGISHPTALGEHNHYTYYAFPFYWANVRYCWSRNFGSLDSVTTTLSHEIAEACTDPDVGTGFVVVDTSKCPPDENGKPQMCEIADVLTCRPKTERINGVLCQPYFSAQSGGCVGSKDAKDGKDGKDQKDSKPESKETKDGKDSKDRKDKDKDIKDAKEKDAKEKERDAPDQETVPPASVLQYLDAINQRLAAIEQELASGRTFVAPDKRPPVGEAAIAAAVKP